jgi:hypothetical protein
MSLEARSPGACPHAQLTLTATSAAVAPQLSPRPYQPPPLLPHRHSVRSRHQTTLYCQHSQQQSNCGSWCCVYDQWVSAAFIGMCATVEPTTHIAHASSQICSLDDAAHHNFPTTTTASPAFSAITSPGLDAAEIGNLAVIACAPPRSLHQARATRLPHLCIAPSSLAFCSPHALTRPGRLLVSELRPQCNANTRGNQPPMLLS